MTGETYSPPAFTMTDYNGYRLDDGIFWAVIIAGLAFCFAHALRRAFRQPIAAKPAREADLSGASASLEEEMERHNLFQRLYHWSNAAAVIALAFSGWKIYQARGFISLAGTTSDYFFWHRWGAAVLLVSLAWHIIYESFIAKGANPMAVSRAEAGRIAAIFNNFFGLSGFYPLAGKYHPGQIFFHWVVAANIFLLISTGFIIWKPFRDLLPLALFGLSWDFIFYCRLFHGFFSATLVASLIGHIYFALFIKKNWPETKSMLTGRISLLAYLESHSKSD